jgi:hypothetical protein
MTARISFSKWIRLAKLKKFHYAVSIGIWQTMAYLNTKHHGGKDYGSISILASD